MYEYPHAKNSRTSSTPQNNFNFNLQQFRNETNETNTREIPHQLNFDGYKV